MQSHLLVNANSRISEHRHIIDTGELLDATIAIGKGIEVSYCFLPKNAGNYTRHIAIGEGATLRATGICIENTTATITTEIMGDGATSTLDILAIATDNASISVEGVAKVDKPYRKANIRVDQTNVLIGENTRVRGVPRLEIATDDIEGGHSCKVHRLGGDALFYLQARGLTESHAESMLLNSEILRHLETIPKQEREQYCREIHEKLSEKKRPD